MMRDFSKANAGDMREVLAFLYAIVVAEESDSVTVAAFRDTLTVDELDDIETVVNPDRLDETSTL